MHGSWPVPSPIADRVARHLEKQGLHSGHEDVRFRPFPGSLLVENVRVSRDGEEDFFASAEAGRIDFSLLALLQGKPALSKITLYGGSAFCPASLSPTGKQEVLLDQMHLVLRQEDDNWAIENLNGKLGNIFVTASGPLPPLPDRPKRPGVWKEVLAEALPRIVREREVLERIHSPHLRIRSWMTDSGKFAVSGEVWAEEIDAPGGVKLSLPHLTTKWHYDGVHWQQEATTFKIAALDWNDQVKGRGAAGRLKWRTGDAIPNLFPDQATLHLARVDTEAGTLTGVQATVAAETFTDLTGRFSLLFRDDPLKGTGEFNWARGTGELALTSLINPTPFLQHKLARQLGFRRDVFFQQPVLAHATARMKNWRFKDASARAVARDADIDGVFLNHAFAQVELRPDRFLVPELVLAYEDFEAVGSYEVDFASQAYRFLFKGTVRPLHISAWFKDWWVALWEDFDFNNEPMEGDVDIQSVLGQPEKVRLVGSVRSGDFFLRGVPFEAVDANLFVLHKYADLFDIRLTREEGTATGAFQFWADPVTSDFGKLVFKINSTLDPTDVAQIFKEKGRHIFGPFRFTQPPRLAMAGTVFGPPLAEETRVILSGQAEAPLEYEGIPLENLTIEGHVEGETLVLPSVRGGFAGGRFAGHVQKWTEENRDRLEFGLRVKEADLAETLAAASRWESETTAKPSPPRAIDGIFDLTVDASGFYGDFESFFGDGKVHIREADLAEVHLLGLLSKVLSATPLGFTSLQFDEAEAKFDLMENKVHFPELRLTGSTSAISGSGDYVLSDDSLDFLIKLHFLKESKIPFLSLLLSPVLEPLAHVMEIRLLGTTADPTWRFLLGPRNILSGISTEKDESEE